MARQLQTAGEDVARLVIVDAAPPHVFAPRQRSIVDAWSRVRYYARERRLLHAVRWQARVRFELGLGRWFGGEEARRLAALRRRHAQAHGSYAPSTIRGDAWFIRSSEWSRSPDYDWTLRWTELLEGDLHVSSVSGSHVGLVEVENSAELAEAIESIIDIDQP
jgi:thioesterase domain-containing protein